MWQASFRQPERRGKTAAENAVTRAARGEIIVNTDASVRLLPHSLKPLVRAFQDPTVGVVSGRDVSIAALDMEGCIARRLVPDRGCARSEGGRSVDDRRQGHIIDIDHRPTPAMANRRRSNQANSRCAQTAMAAFAFSTIA